MTTLISDIDVSRYFNESMTPAQIVAVLIQGAKVHGRDEDPDHEAGDLQDSLRAAWSLIDDEQKHAFCSVLKSLDAGLPYFGFTTDIEKFIGALQSDIEYLPDEVHDLRTLLRACVSVMTPEQAHMLPDHEGIQTLIEVWPDDLSD